MVSRFKGLSRRKVVIIGAATLIIIAAAVAAFIIVKYNNATKTPSETTERVELPEGAVKPNVAPFSGDVLNETDRLNAERESR